MPVRVRYDVTVDALAIELTAGARIARTIQVMPGVNVDVDARGHIVSIEVLDASMHASRSDLAALPSARDYLTLAEAAAESGLAPATLRAQVNRGRLAAIKRGRDWLVDATALLNYMESRDARGRRGPAAKRKSHGVSTAVTKGRPVSVRKRARAVAASGGER